MLERLRAADILCGPINTFADVIADKDLSASLPLIDPLAPSVPQAVGVPIRLDGEYGSTYRPAPAKGQHTGEVLAEFGFSAAEIDGFLAEEAVFTLTP